MNKPWLNEPLTEDFEFLGIQCELRRRFSTQFWRGYVTMPKGHVYANVDYNCIKFDVHGGLTFKEGLKIGFDCAHLHDYIPAYESITRLEEHSTWRSIDYVREQTKGLAAQVVLSMTFNREVWERLWLLCRSGDLDRLEWVQVARAVVENHNVAAITAAIMADNLELALELAKP